LTNLETDVQEIKQMQFVFENGFDRLTALAYKSPEPGRENRADVRIMRKEIEAWPPEIKKFNGRNPLSTQKTARSKTHCK
jgi:hypothetical protein